MDRRTFLTLAGASAAGISPTYAAPSAPLRVGVIGHTGRGDYGHQLDTMWLQVEGVEVAAVADPDPVGLAKALKRLGTDAGFADFRRMLAEVKPDIVAICPRHPDQHREMALAAIKAGARGLYMEKPFCRTPAEADEIRAAATAAGTTIVIAHRNRYHPAMPEVSKAIENGRIGRLLEIRSRGKEDQRGGAEDLWVLGSHVLNLMHHFGGDAISCSATVFENGKRASSADAKDGNEALGRLFGDEIHARYHLAKGVTGYFDTVRNAETEGEAFGLQLIGSKGVIHLRCDQEPFAFLIPGNPFSPPKKTREWIPITSSGIGEPEGNPAAVKASANHVAGARDLIACMNTGRKPLCGMDDGAMTVEMICATFASHLKESREMAIPLKDRRHPLSD